MAQRDTKSTNKESAGMKEQPSRIKLQISLSQPATSNLTTEQKTNPRRHLTLPAPLNNTYPPSPAELYIKSRTQMLFKPTEQQDISPETPSSINSSNTGININSNQSQLSHAERMHKWHQEEAKKICKKQKHRYIYGTLPSSSLAFPYSSFMSPAPSTQLNLPLSSTPQTCTIKKDILTEKSKTNESRNKIKTAAV